MRIRTLRLENIKLLADQTFSFERADGSVRNWTVLLGDNGVCKTSILQAIAIASSGDRMARALVEDAADYVDASGLERGASLEACFEVAGATRSARMVVDPGSHVFKGDEAASFFNDVRDRREPGFLVVGYGVGRRLPKRGEVAVPRDPVADRVEGLFDSHHKMLGVDFFEALREHEEGLGREYARVLGDVLLAHDARGNRLLPWLVSFERRGQNGINAMPKLLESRRLVVDVGRDEPVKLAPHLLSQGYQSTFAWITDLLGHAFLDARAPVDPGEMTGIVLLDEIDLHLHPTWQRRLVPLLRQTFPNVQFVVTTHSPLVLTGFEADEIIKLELRAGHVEQAHFQREPGMQSGSELMEAYFDVPTAGRPDLVHSQARFTELLAADPRTEEEERELETLRAELAPYLESTELADLPAPSEITAELAEPMDREVWRKQLLATKQRRPPGADDEAADAADPKSEPS